jgi:hypothetical protein
VVSSDTACKSKFPEWARLLIVFIVAFDVAAFWQWMGGTYRSEFGGHPDEGANYVAGLFLRDAILKGGRAEDRNDPGTTFADSLSGHYPKVRLGSRPPGFWAVQSAWGFVFGSSRVSVLLFIAALAAGVATLLYGTVREEFGDWGAAAAALLWLCAAAVRESYGMVMPEMLCALTMFGATLAWGRVLDLGRNRDAVGFGLLASAAILTDASGLAVLPMAGIALVAARRWRRMARTGVWLGVAIVALFTGPWIWRFGLGGTEVRAPSAIVQAACFYGEKFTFALGPAVAAFAGAGIWFRCFSKSERRGRWLAVASLAGGVFAHQCLCSASLEVRHVVVAAPALIMLAVAGVRSIGDLMSARFREERERRRREPLWILLLLLLGLPLEVVKQRPKGCDGFAPIARTLLAEAPRGAGILISSDAIGEGMLIAELVMIDPRPAITVEPASVSLVEPGKRASEPGEQSEHFSEDKELVNYLTKGDIQYVVLDDAVPYRQRAPYHDQIRRVLENNVRIFWPVFESPITREGEVQGRSAKVYRVIAGG